MPEASLYAISALDGFSQTFNDTRVWETRDLVMVAIAQPLGGSEALDQKLQALCQLSFPEAGACLRASEAANTDTGSTLALLGLQKDQCLIVIAPERFSPEQSLTSVHNALKDCAYLIDQSDSFAVLEIKGKLAHPALERLCRLDLSKFDAGQVARTSMDHLSVIMEMLDPDHYRLYVPRSAARSFLQTITTTLASVNAI